MNKDFKKAGYASAVIIFILGVLALVVVVAANYFAYSDAVVMIGELVSLFALVGLLVICVTSKSSYNRACMKFAEYILTNRKKEAAQKSFEAERLKEIQNMKTAAAQERENAVAAALEQGRTEGAHAAARNMAQPPMAMPQQPPMPMPQQRRVQTPSADYQSYVQSITPNEEILYNEYGEPVMLRRRVRRQRVVDAADVLYDRYGNPVIRHTDTPAAPVPAAPIPTAPAAPVPAAPIPTAPAAPVPAAPIPTAPAASVSAAPIPTAPAAPVSAAPIPTAPAAPVSAYPIPTAPAAPVSAAPIPTAPAAPVSAYPIPTAPAAPVSAALAEEPVVPTVAAAAPPEIPYQPSPNYPPLETLLQHDRNSNGQEHPANLPTSYKEGTGNPSPISINPYKG